MAAEAGSIHTHSMPCAGAVSSKPGAEDVTVVELSYLSRFVRASAHTLNLLAGQSQHGP
jgi:hypothetical protein